MIESLVILAIVLLVVGAVLLGGTLLLMALMVLRPPRMTDGKASFVLRRISPGDLGMQFEETRFDVRDARGGQRLPIAAWWIPHPRGGEKCAVLIHGYADAKVGAIAWAPMWQQLGYHVLAFDQRAHGYSGGNYTTAGFFERHDLDQILNQLVAERTDQARQLVLFGVSLGAAVALATAQTRDDIDALVLECPYASYREAAAAHAQVMQMPLPSLAPVALRLAEWISGADFDAASPVELLERVKTPALVILAGADPFVPPPEAAALERALRARAARGLPGEYWIVPDTTHVHGLAVDPDAYARRIEAFLEANRTAREFAAR